MAEVTSIADRLNRLSDTVRAKQVLKRNQRADDWARVQRDLPDHAAFIRDVTQLFGKPERLTVTKAGGEVILDSGRYV